MVKRTSTIANVLLKLLVVLMIAQNFILQENIVIADERGHVVKNMSPGKQPGVLMRIDQGSIDQLKYALRDFLPHYFNYDLDLP